MNDPFLLQRSNATELFLIRHADAAADAEISTADGEANDRPLSLIGIEQAQALVERLNKTRIDVLYSSPLKRCLQTAEPLATYFGLTLNVIADLRELHYTALHPSVSSQEASFLDSRGHPLEEQQVHAISIAGEAGSWDALEQCEPSQSFRRRVISAFEEIVRHHPGQRVLVCTHAGVINTYVAEVLGLQQDFFFPCANASITIVRVAANRHVLYTLNDLAHVRLSRYIRQLTDYSASPVN